MKYLEFREKTANLPIIGKDTVCALSPVNPKNLHDQISRWQKKGLIYKLRQGLYALDASDRKAQFSNYFLANQICSPSYISLETAMGFYSMIPEGVFAYTCITTKKTQEYHNHYGSFYYHNLDVELFSDFLVYQDEFDNSFYMASREKALADFLFFKLRGLKDYDKDVFDESFRLQNLEELDLAKLLAISEKFQSKKLSEAVKWLIELIEKGDL